MKIRLSKGCLRADTLAEMCRGTLCGGSALEILIDGICTDSREADESTLFCALRGERVDGHDYIKSAVAKGCRCILCEAVEPSLEQSEVVFIVVKDTELALADFARAYRRQLSVRTVGVTGSVGKTTAKEMIFAVLNRAWRAYKTPGNHNSLIGMPLSVGEIENDCQWAVLEMGMSGFGEIERLSTVAEPEIAVITNIGTAHMEMLGSRENICRAKLEILEGLRDGGYLLLNGDEPLLAGIGGKRYQTVYVSLERSDCDYHAENIRVRDGYTLFDLIWNGGVARDLRINVMGRHNVYAAAFAFAVGILSGMKAEKIREGLLDFASEGLRQHLAQCGEWIFLEDCYNASPESMTASLEVLRAYCRQTNRRSVAVLGDMLELGSQSCAMHQKVGGSVADMGIDELITLGDLGGQIAVGARRRGMQAVTELELPREDSCEVLAEKIRQRLCPGDAVLFKASRGVGAERLIAALRSSAESDDGLKNTKRD